MPQPSASSTRRLLLGALAVMTLAGVAACTPPSAPPATGGPIGLHERFTGLVNGSHDDPVVTTACGGPTWEGRTGPAVGGQTLSVTRDPAGRGNTGSNGIVFAEPSTASPIVVAIDSYDTEAAFPTDIAVPCDGTGTVTFTPCWGVVGCLGEATADTVKVRFVNIAD